ncbi:MAG: glutamate synthase subunit alpha, partial [Cyanobacteria bacterium]|nr:glutamate synthase subunit alpha [Cyanobacteriota bacterium]
MSFRTPPVWPHRDSAAPQSVTGEKDACGVGFLAHLQGVPSHWVLQQALKGLRCMEHRGGCGGDGDSGDGAGILSAIPWGLLEAVWPAATGLDQGVRGLGMVFLPQDLAQRETVRQLCEQEASQLGLKSLGWRPVPVDPSVLGPMARESAPCIEQWLLLEPQANPEVSEEVDAAVLDLFYSDLRDGRFAVNFAVYHRRFSTNTLPRWPLAQPMRLLGHNGEINTLLGNINWASAAEANLEAVWGEAASDLRPLVNPAFSDSANLDATLELMVRSGRPITDSLLTLVPEAFRDQPELDDRPAIKAFYEYNACLQEPWDGPALLVFSDGKMVGATLDRNGLRPARYCITSDGYVVMGSETGVVDLEEDRILEKGRLGPGQMLAVDLAQHRILRNWDVKGEAADRHPYTSWIAEHRREMAPGVWLEITLLSDL